MDYDFKEICEQFKIDGEFVSAERYGEGHINDTNSCGIYFSSDVIK